MYRLTKPSSSSHHLITKSTHLLNFICPQSKLHTNYYKQPYSIIVTPLYTTTKQTNSLQSCRQYTFAKDVQTPGNDPIKATDIAPKQPESIDDGSKSVEPKQPLTLKEKLELASLKEKIVKNVKGIQCPGCGAAFQSESIEKPGYLKPEKLKEINEAKFAKPDLVLTELEPAIESLTKNDDSPVHLSPTKTNNNTGNKKTTLSEDEIHEIAKSIEDPDIRDLFLTSSEIDESLTADNDGNLIQPNNAENPFLPTRPQPPKPTVCKRCHDLKHHNKIANSESVDAWKENIISDPNALRFLKYEPNALIVVVCDIFDIPGSLIPNLGQFIGEAKPKSSSDDSSITYKKGKNDHRKRNIILVANKMDLLPKETHFERIANNWLRPIIKETLGSTLPLRSINFVSATKNLGIRELAETIQELRRPDEDVYLVGRANVGKSELVNSLLRISLRDPTKVKHDVMTANIPGTTSGVCKIPLEIFSKSLVPVGWKPASASSICVSKPHDNGHRFVYDTPGIFSSKSILNFLAFDELKDVVPNKRVVPLTYKIRPGQSICFGGLGRLDFVIPPELVPTITPSSDGGSSIETTEEATAEHKKKIKSLWISVTAFSRLPVHISKTTKVDDMFNNQIAKGLPAPALTPPYDLGKDRLLRYPPMRIGLEVDYVGQHKSMATTDIVFSGVGWFSLAGILPSQYTIKVRALSPFGTGIYQRKPMLPFEFKGKITKYTSNSRKTMI
ncbi:nitric oxide associated protein 1 [Mycoemilia scoparia]|uniref:Nitric oxide associated protein 1 n=1 Tax=Mycoemilia scoparia TaxID=417184 RepID=A0A9W7ZTN8_9FUNG|nr:nitric oxide associated protein 1 [Mycoemilia scoparia]